MSQTAAKAKSPLWKRALLRTGTIAGTGAVIAIAGGLVFAGTTGLAERADAVIGPDPAPLTSIDAMRISQQDSFTTTRRFYGQVEAAQTVDIAFEQGGEIDALFVEEGASISEGQVIATLDTRLLDAEKTRLEATRRALEAQAELARLTTERQMQLRERGFASDQTVDSNRFGLAGIEAQLAEVDAAILAVEVRLSQTEIVAPFDARVAARLVDQGSIVGVGQSIVTLLQDNDPMFRVGVDPALAGHFSTDEGEAAAYSIALDGQVYEATFAGFRPDLDPQTRTRTALFNIQTEDAVFLQTGVLTLHPTLEGSGYVVPMSALRDGVRGLWNVMTLSPTGSGDVFLVGEAAVEVMQLQGETAFVRGTLSGDALIIPDGTNRVVPGEEVVLSDLAEMGSVLTSMASE